MMDSARLRVARGPFGWANVTLPADHAATIVPFPRPAIRWRGCCSVWASISANSFKREADATPHGTADYNCRRVGSKRSRSQSPVRLADMTSKVLAIPGIKGNHQAR